MEPNEAIPKGWSVSPVSANYTVTLLVFSWALLPAGFMLLLLIFGRYPEVRLPLAACTWALFVFTFFTGFSQRQGALHDGRVLLCATVLGGAGVLLGLVWALDLDAWWWAVHAVVLGCVPVLFVTMNHLASCTAPAIERPWHATHRLSSAALPGWQVLTGAWTQDEMARTHRNGVLYVLYGCIVGEHTRLRIEAFAYGSTFPFDGIADVRWNALKAAMSDESEEA